MKKILNALLIAMTVFACQEPEAPQTPEELEPTTPEVESKNLSIWSTGSKYRILYSPSEDDNLGQSCANDIAEAVKTSARVILPVVTENKSTAATEVEISVGMTSNEDVKSYLAGVKDTFDYTIRVSGLRLIVCGASGWSLKVATERLISEYIRPQKAIPKDLKIDGNCRGQQIFPLQSGANLRILDNNIWSYNKDEIPAAWAALGGDPRNAFRSKQYAAMVKALMPDVFAWQEYSAPMQEVMEPQITDKYALAIPDGSPGVRNATPLYYNKSTVEPVLVHYLLFPGEYNNSNSKSYTSAVFKHKATGAHFIVVGTHLWYKSDSEMAGSSAARTAQAQLISNEVEDLLIEYDCPVFVMGDMNCKLDSDAMRVFTSRDYQDCGLSAKVYRDSFKGHHTCSETAGFAWTPQANNDCATAIDHIFEFNCGKQAEVLTHKIITAAFTISLTDHCPRYIDVRLEPEADPVPVEGAVELADATTRILFIGNSFTKDAVEHLPGIVAAAGIKDITMAHVYHGGRTIPLYNDWSLADYTLYKAEKGASSWTKHGSQVTIAQVVSGGRWDIITVQEHTGNYAAWSWTPEEKTAVVELLKKLADTQKTPPDFYYILSQAYYDMSKIASRSKPYITWSDQAGMWRVITDQAKKVVAETDIKDVISTGCALQNLRTSGLDTPLNLTRDGYHMDFGTARYTAACTVYGKLIEPIFKIGLENNSYRYTKSDYSLGNYCSPVTDATAPVCRKAARYAIENPYEVTDMKGEGGSSGGGDAYAFQGSGTEADPYLVGTPADMQGMASVLVEGQIRHFKMTADIDMSSVANWTPVVPTDNTLGLQFDGDGHTLKNLTCSNQPFASLFGMLYGGVKNLTLQDCSVSNTESCALLAVWGGNGLGTCPAVVSGVHARNCTVNMTSTTSTPTGGLFANAGKLTLQNSSFQGTIQSAASSGTHFLGGLVGKIAVSGATISRCHADVQIKGVYSSMLGGLVGGCYTGCPVNISDCYSTGAITGKCLYMGGIVGDLVSSSTVSRCYSTMDLTGGYNHGGIVGRASNRINPNTTGSFDTIMDITVQDCIAWNGAIRTSGSGEKPSSHYSSGAVVGFTVYRNNLLNCRRRPDMVFHVYANESYNILLDNENVTPSTPLVKPSTDVYHCPYNGKAVAPGETVSSVAKSLGWSDAVWDFSENLPVLK